jgi:transposase InsO family protein
LKLVRRYQRYGYRRMTALLRREGWVVNRKRVYRLWQKLRLKVPQRQKRRRRHPAVAAGASRLRAQAPGHLWSYDFAWDETLDGRRLKLLAMYDEGTRTCLALRAERRIGTWQVRGTLDELMSQHGAPGHLRSDNGPEFVEKALCRWLDEQRIRTAFILQGEPRESVCRVVLQPAV